MMKTNGALPREVSAQIQQLTRIEALHLTALISMFLAEQSEGCSYTMLEDFEANVFPLATSAQVVAVLRTIDSFAGDNGETKLDPILTATAEFSAY